MEERPSRLRISVSSIKEFDLTEGEIRQAKRQGELKRRPSIANPATIKKSWDDALTNEQSNSSPERGVKRTVSLSASRKGSKPNTTSIYKSASSELAEKKPSNSVVPDARKRSSSVDQQSKIPPHATSKERYPQQDIAIKVTHVRDQSPTHSVEKPASHQIIKAIRKRSSSNEQHRQSSSSTTPKYSSLKPGVEDKQSGNTNTPKDASKKSKSAGAASKREHAPNTTSRKLDILSSAPAGNRHKDSLGVTNSSSPGMNSLSPSSHNVKQSKSKQNADRKPSLDPDHHEHADSARRSSGTPRSSARKQRGPAFVSDATPFSDTPFPFHDTQRKTTGVSDANPCWVETPTPWGGLGSEDVAAVICTSTDMLATQRRFSVASSTKKERRGSTKEKNKRSLDHRKSLSGEEEPQCLSLSMAQAVTEEHKRDFFTVLDDDVLEKLRERTAEMKAKKSQTNTLETDKGSHAQLRKTSNSDTNVKRNTSGRFGSSTTSTAVGRKGSRKSEEDRVKEKTSEEDILKQDIKDAQSQVMVLENPVKKNEKDKVSSDEDGDKRNVYASAILDKWMADGAKGSTKGSANKNAKQNGSKWKQIKQMLGVKKPTTVKEKVLQTLTQKHINLLIPQTLPDPREISPADQIPTVGVSPINTVPDREAGHSQGPGSGQIQEEFFTSPDSYRSSIAQARQRMSHRPSPALSSKKAAASEKPATSTAVTITEAVEEPLAPKTSATAEHETTEGDEEEATLADAVPEERVIRSDWVTSSSSEVTVVGSDGIVSRRRKSTLRRKRKSSAQKYHDWKRKTSTKAYIEYRRKTDPRHHVDLDQLSQMSSLSLYPASSTGAATVEDKTSWSDLSSVQTVQESGGPTDGRTPKSVTKGTSTEGRGRTEGTQTSSSEYLLLDRRSCLVKVLAALQRLNTDQALQVARILRRSVAEDRVYEDVNVKKTLEPKRSEIDARNVALTRVESEKVVPQGSASRTGVIPDTIPDQDYDELMRIVSQIDLMVRSKLRITAAPYSLIYETLINCHLEITQDYSPSVAVFNYYLTEQGHPLFDDTSGFFRPTILQVPRESLYPRLYAHKPLEEPRELPVGGRLLDLQLLLDELLICPFCGQDVVWGQDAMCVEFCCDSFGEVISHEYEDDLGRIRRQAALWQRRAAIGQLDEDPELLAAALGAASAEQHPPANLHCQLEKRTRLRALQRYGQDGTAPGKAPQLLPFDIAMIKQGSGMKAIVDTKEGKKKSRRSRLKSVGETAVGRKGSAVGRRHGSEPRRRTHGKRGPGVGGGSAGDEDWPWGGKRGSRGRRKRSTKRDISMEVGKLEDRMGRRLTKEEMVVILESENVMRSDARGLSITAEGIEEKLDVTSLENIHDRGLRKKSSKGSLDFLLGETIGFKLSSLLHDADDEAGDTETSAPSRRRGKGHRRARRKTRAARDRQVERSVIALDGRESRTKRAERAERDSQGPDDQLHYRLSDSAFLEEGLTQLPWDGAEGDVATATDPKPLLATHPVESGQRQFLQERYPDGKLFVTWFDDGSGHVMYPSGEPAILITVEPAGRRFVVLPDQPCGGMSSSNCVLAMFDPRGIGFVYSTKGEPRLLLDQHEGWYHRDDGTIRRWHWTDLDDHLNHSPTLQPVIFAVSRHVAIRVIRQDYIVLSFWANQRSARFNVGVTAESGPGPAFPDQYRLICPASDHQQLSELTGRVRRILGDMARITDEPVKYLIHHQKLLQRGLNVPIRRTPQWLSAEPRRPQLPGGVSAALARRSEAALGSSGRRAFLLQQMTLPSRTGEEPTADRTPAAAVPPPPPPLAPQSPPQLTQTQQAPEATLHQTPPTEVV